MCHLRSVKRRRKQRAFGGIMSSIIPSMLAFIHLYFDYFLDFLYGLYYNSKKKIVSASKDPILELSATEMARKIREGELKSEEVVLAHINRIKEVNGLLNAVIDERFDAALEEARRVDENIAKGVYAGRDFKQKIFLGVPFTTKGTTVCKGLDVSFGLVPRKGMKGTEDAKVVENMKNSGAILLALTNVPQLSIWSEAHNPVFGITNNPYDTTRNVGGSSGGECSIIAACGSAIGIGTDIGGSIRIPAYMCGLFGHKCSPTVTPTKGLTFRNGSEQDRTMVVAGPISRYCEDLIPGLKAILGADACRSLQLDKKVDIAKLKYYFIEEMPSLLISPVRSDVMKSFRSVVEHFRKMTGKAQELEIEELAYTARLYTKALANEGNDFSYDVTNKKYRAVWYRELFKYIFRCSNLSFSSVMVLINAQVLRKATSEWFEENTEKIKSELLSKLGNDGVLFFVSQPTTAHYHHLSYLRPYNLLYFSLFNLLKFPVTQVPLGLSHDGLPLGVQVVSAPFNDHLCLAVAQELESVFGGYVPPNSQA
ncbi:PREDICTED: fatty-acid amide hydrolase 2-like isoform X2 [Nicrophorus vespilloides]|uniref:Fatty-acid amide hydrolase 2-like isoform X2 n=1 Tax=Nicrophorus vespilloides TaxID=110193 RepID=A0ABM1N7M7_NICVS|nr:PREDICTED: fatty-acid amide hydrolase 2-like isoform X2 [Nicrophorus vespilloides]